MTCCSCNCWKETSWSQRNERTHFSAAQAKSLYHVVHSGGNLLQRGLGFSPLQHTSDTNYVRDQKSPMVGVESEHSWSLALDKGPKAEPLFARTSLDCTLFQTDEYGLFKQRNRAFSVAPTADDFPSQPELGVRCSVLISDPLGRFWDAWGSLSREGLCSRDSLEPAQQVQL